MRSIKLLGMSFVAAAFLTGCSFTEIPVDTQKFNYEKVHSLKNMELPAVQIISTDNYFSKVESINKNVPNIDINIHFKNKTLKEIFALLPLNVKLDKEFENHKIKFLSHNGNLKDLLNKIGELSGLYWTYENSAISFSRTKVIVYKFPMFSAEKLNLIFNITSDSSDNFNVASITTDVFDEIKTSLGDISKEFIIEGSYEESVERLSIDRDTNEVQKNKTNRVEVLDSLVKNIENGQNNRLLDSIKDINTLNDTTLEQTSITNGFVRNNKEPAVAKTPAKGGVEELNDVKKLLEYDIKKDSSTSGNAESAKRKNNEISDNKESSNKTLEQNNKNNSNNNVDNLVNNNVDTLENSTITKITSLYKKTINPEGNNVSILKESGMVIVNVDKNYEQKIDTVLESITSNIMSNMVVMDFYIVEANKTKLKELTATLNATRNSQGSQSKIDLGSSGLTFSKDTLADTLTDLNVIGGVESLIGGLIKYTTEDTKSRVLTNPKILSIPNVPSRIKSSTAYPYLNVQSLGDNDTGPSMNIEFINEGTDIALLSNVYGDDIFLSLGVKLNKYVGDKELNAGTLGTFTVPIQSPRTLNTTFRMKAGEITIIGGMNALEHTKKDNYQTILPNGIGAEVKDSELLIIAAPRIIRYVKK